MVVVITGANGFLGSHLLEQSAELGYQTIGMVRPESDHSNIRRHSEVVATDYTKASISDELQAIKDQYGSIDLFIHNAGATRANSSRGFENINAGLTRTIIEVLREEKMLGNAGKFIYISSMAAKGPVGAEGPVSQYGKSKLLAESIVTSSNLTYNIFRPTAIYGPRDIQFLRLVRAVKKRIYPSVAPKQKMTLIHVADAARNILSCSVLLKNKVIPLEDGQVYSHVQLEKAIEHALQVRSFTLYIPAYLALLSIKLEEKIAYLFGKNPSMTAEKFLEITQDWDHDHQKEHKTYGLSMEFDLTEGMADTIRYYQKHNLI